MTKTCARCGMSKLVTEFYADKRRKDGRAGWCKPCFLAYIAARRRGELPERSKLSVSRAALHAAEMHYCRQCEEVKPVEAFYVVGGFLTSPCRACQIAHSVEAKRARRKPSVLALHRADMKARGVWECRKCGQEKPEGEFLIVNGLRTSPCRSCANVQQMADYMPHPRVRGAHVDPIKKRANKKARKARERGAPISDFTGEQWEAMKIAFDHRCAYCNVQTEKLTQDHIYPLSLGGAHTLRNIVPACRTCNSRKGNRPADHFRKILAAVTESPRGDV